MADVVDIEEAREQKADEQIAMSEEQLLEFFVFEGWGRESIAFIIDLMRRTVIAEQSLLALDELGKAEVGADVLHLNGQVQVQESTRIGIIGVEVERGGGHEVGCSTRELGCESASDPPACSLGGYARTICCGLRGVNAVGRSVTALGQRLDAHGTPKHPPELIARKRSVACHQGVGGGSNLFPH